jgi:hypothetical protein
VSPNDCFRTVLHLTGLTKHADLVLALFTLGGLPISASRLRSLRSVPSNSSFKAMQPQELDAFFQGLFLYRDAQAQQGHQVFQFRPLAPEQLATLMADQDQTSTSTPTIESKEPPQPT